MFYENTLKVNFILTPVEDNVSLVLHTCKTFDEINAFRRIKSK